MFKPESCALSLSPYKPFAMYAYQFQMSTGIDCMHAHVLACVCLQFSVYTRKYVQTMSDGFSLCLPNNVRK